MNETITFILRPPMFPPMFPPFPRWIGTFDDVDDSHRCRISDLRSPLFLHMPREPANESQGCRIFAARQKETRFRTSGR